MTVGGQLHPEAASVARSLAMEEVELELTENGEKSVKKQAKTDDGEEYIVYTRRWLILGLFVAYSASNAFQWTQLVIITSILEKYYGVSTLAVYWTSMIYMVCYIPLIFPASWFLDKKGLRLGVLLGSAGTCAGSWLKVFSTRRAFVWASSLVLRAPAQGAGSRCSRQEGPSSGRPPWFCGHLRRELAQGVLDKKGLRLGVLLGSAGTCAGS